MTSRTFLVGTGVESLYTCRLTNEGQLELVNEYSCGKGSTWLFQRNNLLYVVNEHSNQIETFSIDDCQQGKITLKNTISSIGHTPCWLDIDPSGKWLAVTNYGHEGTSNVVLFPLNESNYPEEKGAQIITIDGKGPNVARQDHSHCHQALFYEGFFYVVDLGTDTLNVYRFNEQTGEVTLVGERIRTEPGAGPRHILFHPNKTLAFVCNELNSTTDVYRLDSSVGKLELQQTIKTRREEDENDKNKENYTAELQFTPDQKSLLVSNRGDENLVIYNLNIDKSEVLSLKEHLDCHGSFTRYFTFDPTETFLLVANQKSNNLISFRYNPDNQTYTFVSELKNIQSPQHLLFLS